MFIFGKVYSDRGEAGRIGDALDAVEEEGWGVLGVLWKITSRVITILLLVRSQT
jgi:hypothetical protein